MSDELEIVSIDKISKNIQVKQFTGGVQAGFPSPADDFKENKLSLDEKFLSNPDATFLVRVKGDSMFPTLLKGDLLIVKSDKSLIDKKIGIFSVNNTEFTVKRYLKEENKLKADNKVYQDIIIEEDDTVLCLGMVENLIRDLQW